MILRLNEKPPFYCQITIQDLPETPASVPGPQDEKLDLPDVPTKVPVAPDVVTDDAKDSATIKGIILSALQTTYSLLLNFKFLTPFWICSYGGTGAGLICI